MPNLAEDTAFIGTNSEPFCFILPPSATHAYSYLDLMDYATRIARSNTRKPKTTKCLEKIRQEIRQLALTANKEDWDGEGATKLSAKTRDIALKLVDSWPSYVLENDIDIDVTPFGSIDFGWVLERNVMLNILVLSSGEIAFAYSIGDKGDSGKELWKGVLSTRVSEILDIVFNQQQSDG